MAKYRLLIVDDSSVTRQTFRRVFENHDQMEIVGAYSLARGESSLVEAMPDAVILDVSLPQALSLLRNLRNRSPSLVIIAFGRNARTGSPVAVDAVLLGADEVRSKPDRDAELEPHIRHEILPLLIRLLARAGPTSPGNEFEVPANFSPRKPNVQPKRRPELIVVAGSTGATPFLTSLLSALTSKLAPILVVQHMPVGFTKLLAERLSRSTPHVVREAGSAHVLDGNEVWIAPANYHLAVAFREGALMVETNSDPPENQCRPSADILFRSAAHAVGEGVVAVVLSGLGADGTAGCRAIHEKGGCVLVQDPATCPAGGMPASVIKAGLASQVGAIDALKDNILRAFAESSR